MKYCISLSFLILLLIQVKAQLLTGRVIDAASKLPIPFAHISVTGTRVGTNADIDGKFLLTTNVPVSVTVSSVGYVKSSVEITESTLVIELKESLLELKEVVITPHENPAFDIIRKVRLNRLANDPRQVDSYSFNSYNKLFIKLADDSRVYKHDSTLKLRMDSSELFVSESVVNHKFKKPDKTREHILGHKTSGIKSPLFASILTDFQPISFYDEWFFMNITDKSYQNPVYDKGFQKYDFELLDTLYTANDSTFVISFQPQRDKNFEGLKGVLYINSNGYAIENVMAESCSATDGFAFTLQQKYQYKEMHWFPFQLNTDVYVQDKKNLLYGVCYVHKSYFSDIKFNVDLSNSEFSSVTRTLAEDVSLKNQEFWNKNRAVDLSLRENNTYTFFAKNPSNYLNAVFATAEYLSTGFIQMQNLKIPINRLVSFNQYEGLRLGVGLQTNDRISKTIYYGAYAAYGLRDNALKFGGDIQVRANDPARTTIDFFYQNDVSEPASTISVIKNNNAVLKDGYRGLLTSRMDSVERFGTSFNSYLTPNLNFELSVSRETRVPTYSYQKKFSDASYLRNTFKTNEFAVSFKYAVGEKRLDLNGGVFTTTKPATLFEVKISKAVNLSDESLNYFKVHTSVDHAINTRLFGKTFLHGMFGYTYGDLPYPYLFNGRGTSQDITFFYLQNTFQTMGIYEFVADKYVSVFVSQNFGSLLWKSNKRFSTPEFTLTNGAYWARLSNSASHEWINVKTARDGYYEAGAIVTKLLRIRYFKIMFIDIGAGVFYRYGRYAYEKQKDNLAFKIIVGGSI
jgi:hypothetical protein